MPYTVWSRGELIGETDLAFRDIGFAHCRSGHFHPNSYGESLLPLLASVSHCMRAYMHRDCIGPDGDSIVRPDYLSSSMFADVAEYLQRVQGFQLELRDELGVIVPTTDIGIQDGEPSWSDAATAGDDESEGDAELEHASDRPWPNNERGFDSGETKRVGQQLSERLVDEGDIADEVALELSEQMEGHEYTWVENDITVPVGWGADMAQGDDELGSGWNTSLRDIPEFPRYQVHVVLAQVNDTIPPDQSGEQVCRQQAG